MKPDHQYEVRHPEGEPPHPTFATWNEALSAQIKFNKEVSGHKARRIPKSNIPIEITCPECSSAYTGWPDDKGKICFDCFAAKELAKT